MHGQRLREYLGELVGAGSAVFSGPWAATGPVAGLVAVAMPSSLVAVTSIRTIAPTSPHGSDPL